MSIECVYCQVVRCDACHEALSNHDEGYVMHLTEQERLEAVPELGWREVGDLHLCDDCLALLVPDVSEVFARATFAGPTHLASVVRSKLVKGHVAGLRALFVPPPCRTVCGDALHGTVVVMQAPIGDQVCSVCIDTVDSYRRLQAYQRGLAIYTSLQMDEVHASEGRR